MSRKYYRFILGLIIAVPLSAIIAFAATVGNTGFSANFLLQWLDGWWFGFVIAYPSALLIVPQAIKLTDKFNWKDS
jgi:Protein of unknown function (DUF2798)